MTGSQAPPDALKTAGNTAGSLAATLTPGEACSKSRQREVFMKVRPAQSSSPCVSLFSCCAPRRRPPRCDPSCCRTAGRRVPGPGTGSLRSCTDANGAHAPRRGTGRALAAWGRGHHQPGIGPVLQQLLHFLRQRRCAGIGQRQTGHLCRASPEQELAVTGWQLQPQQCAGGKRAGRHQRPRLHHQSQRTAAHTPGSAWLADAVGRPRPLGCRDAWRAHSLHPGGGTCNVRKLRSPLRRDQRALLHQPVLQLGQTRCGTPPAGIAAMPRLCLFQRHGWPPWATGRSRLQSRAGRRAPDTAARAKARISATDPCWPASSWASGRPCPCRLT